MHFIPLLVLVLVVGCIAVRNYVPGAYYTGWDNTHPELNIKEFASRVFGGAWAQYQGTGAPAAQSQLAELARFPFIAFLTWALPSHLVRYVNFFILVLCGGISMYFFLLKSIFVHSWYGWRRYISLFGALYYILNIVSIQQFYINFELFTIQFAFFPFVLLTVDRFIKHTSVRSALLYIFALFLFIPTAFVPTIAYIAFALLGAFAFFSAVEQYGFSAKTVKSLSLVCFIFLLINSYWIIPNVYYVLKHSNYVENSRSNQLFAQEVLASVKESGTVTNILSGMHYLFHWKDYNFHTKQYEYIFKPWIEYYLHHFSVVQSSLFLFSGLTLIGLLTACLSRRRIYYCGLILPFLFIFLFIWIGTFDSQNILSKLYSFGPFREAFRNPFTKLSNYYSFYTSVLIVIAIDFTLRQIHLQKRPYSTILQTVFSSLTYLLLGAISLPVLYGYFLNPLLKTGIPNEYRAMFDYLRTRPSNARVLELPFFSDAGWLYYNWQGQPGASGYQGMGFYIFGMSQPLLTPDHARWTETSDFFYHELRHTLNSKDAAKLQNILNKYYVDIMVLDKNSIHPNMPDYDYDQIIQLINQTDFVQKWKQSNIYVYERPSLQNNTGLITPTTLHTIQQESGRKRVDTAYAVYGSYIDTGSEMKKDALIFPFADLTKLQNDQLTYANSDISISKKVPQNAYTITIPNVLFSYNRSFFNSTYKDNTFSIEFPITKIIFNDEYEYIYPQINNIYVNMDQQYDSVIFWLGSSMYEVRRNETIHAVAHFNSNDEARLSYTGKYVSDSDISSLEFSTLALSSHTNYSYESTTVELNELTSIKVISNGVQIPITLDLNKSRNCADSFDVGSVRSVDSGNGVRYSANGFAVNCAWADLDGITADYPYVLYIQGKNISGRGMKLFIGYNEPNTIPEAFIFPQSTFQSSLLLLPITSFIPQSYAVNWETRSFGRQSINEVHNATLFPFPLDVVSQVSIQPKTYEPIKNSATIEESKKISTFYYSAKVACSESPPDHCMVGIQQAFDKGWIAFDGSFKPLQHFTYNGWANMWRVNSSSTIYIVYIPQYIAFIAILLSVVYIFWLCYKLYRRHEKIL